MCRFVVVQDVGLTPYALLHTVYTSRYAGQVTFQELDKLTEYVH
jgi:hypothetical protein